MTHNTFPLDSEGTPDGLSKLRHHLDLVPAEPLLANGEPSEPLLHLAAAAGRVRTHLTHHYDHNFDALVHDTSEPSPAAGGLLHLLVYSSVNYANPLNAARKVEAARDQDLTYVKALVLQGMIKTLPTLTAGQPYILTSYDQVVGGVTQNLSPALFANDMGYLVLQTPLVRLGAPAGELPISNLARRTEYGTEERHLITGEEQVKAAIAAQIPRAMRLQAGGEEPTPRSEFVILGAIDSAQSCGTTLADCCSPDDVNWARELLRNYIATHNPDDMISRHVAEALASITRPSQA